MFYNLNSSKSWRCISFALLQLWLPVAIHAQNANPPAEATEQAADGLTQPTALTISFRGSCQYSEDGVTFAKLDRSHIFDQGAILRTGDDGRADFFFRRTGTTVRLQPNTEIKLERMSVEIKDGLPVVHTLLDLRAGRIFTVVRSVVKGSALEIKNAAGRAVVEGSGIGRYIITADGTHVSARGSVIPLKVIGENGITIISAGEQFSPKDGKMLPVSPTYQVKEMIELDEIEATAEGATAAAPSPKR